MSVLTKELASTFLAPLRGNLAVITAHDLQTKTALSRFLVGCLKHQAGGAVILDSGVYYCTNINRIADGGGPSVDAQIWLLPEGDFEVTSLVPLVSSGSKLLLIDDLNSLYSLAAEGQSLHQLTVLLKMLSYNARVNGSWVIATASRADAWPRREEAKQRSVPSAGDLSVDAESRDGSLKLKAGFRSGWPGGELSVYFAM